jgi:hypothetical protein
VIKSTDLEYGIVVLAISEEAMFMVDCEEFIRQEVADHAFYEEQGAQVLPGPPELITYSTGALAFGYPVWRYLRGEVK